MTKAIGALPSKEGVKNQAGRRPPLPIIPGPGASNALNLSTGPEGIYNTPGDGRQGVFVMFGKGISGGSSLGGPSALGADPPAGPLEAVEELFRLPEFRLEDEGPPEGADGLERIPAFGQGDGHVVVDDSIIGGDRNGFPVVVDGFPEFFLPPEGEA
jgi:hypothetical protein